MRSLGSRAGLLFSLSFTTLVFFNYLYFLNGGSLQEAGCGLLR